MNSETLYELERSAVLDAIPEDRAARIIQKKLNQMVQEEKVLILTNEEDRMIRSFRRFKTNLRKSGEVFKWQTAIEPGVVIAEDTALIVDPQEVSA